MTVAGPIITSVPQTFILGESDVMQSKQRGQRRDDSV